MELRPSDRTLSVGLMYQIEACDVYMAYLLSTGCTDLEAYVLIHGTGGTGEGKALAMRVSRYKDAHPGIQECANWVMASKGFVAPDDGVKKKRRRKGDEEDKSGVYSKSDALDMVNHLIKHGGLTDKEKLNALDLLNKLQQWNKEDNKDEEELVHFFLPMTCDRCKLYMDKKNEFKI